MHKIKERFPTRNYNRAIELPSKDEDADEIDLYPNAIRKLYYIFETR
jgi:DNA-binding transcriptional regulator YhcF (GntR family)